MNRVAVPETLSPREEVVEILAEKLFAMIVHRLCRAKVCTRCGAFSREAAQATRPGGPTPT